MLLTHIQEKKIARKNKLCFNIYTMNGSPNYPEKAAHLSGLFPNIVVQEGAVEKPLRDYSVSEQAAILCAYGDLTEDDEGEEFPEE